MNDRSGETELRLVWGGPAGRNGGDSARGRLLDADGLAAAYPWPVDASSEGGSGSPATRWVRAMMVTTLDGAAAGADGLSGTISGSADKRVFGAVRRFADAVLVGAGTFRSEEYGAMRARGEVTRRLRADRGQQVAPRLAIVSHSLDLPWGAEAFTNSAVPPLVLTGDDVDADTLATARERAAAGDAEIVVAGDGGPAALVAALVERGLTRIVCEGGPSLLAGLARDEVLDEADITLAPLFAGTENTPHTPAIDPARRLRLAHVITGDGFLMNRYVRT